MRRWIVLVMVVLLPLREGAGDLMSLQMVRSNPAHSAVLMAPDCPMHSATDASQVVGDAGAHVGSGMDSCSSCELCIPIAELPSGSLEAVSFAMHQPPSMPLLAFVSASLDPAVKPPIS